MRVMVRDSVKELIGARWARMVAVVAVVSMSTWLLWLLLGPVRFFADDWAFVENRHLWGLDTLLRDHAGHPVVLPALSFLIGFNTVGLDTMWYFKAMLMAVHLGVCGAVAVRVWRRHGWLAGLAAWSTICFMGAGAQNIVHFFQIGFVGSVLFFLLSLGALERLGSGGRNVDAMWVAILLTGSVACTTVGIAAVVAAGGVLVLDRRTWRHLWSVAVPVMLYLAWRSRYGTATSNTSSIGTMVRYVWEAVRNTGAAIGFGNRVLGAAIVVALFAVAIRHALSRREPHLLAGPLFVGAFWALTAVSRAERQFFLDDPSPSRYKYVAVVGLLVSANDLLPPVVAAGARTRRAAVAAVVAVLVGAGSIWSGYPALMATRDHFAHWGNWSAARLAVVDAHPGPVAQDTWIDPLFYFTRVTVGDYLSVSATLGSRGGLTASEFAELSGDVLSGAEELILPLVIKTESLDSSCSGEVVRDSVVEVAPGGTVHFEVREETTVMVSRWLPADPEGPGVHMLAAGNWSISVPDDDLPGFWTFEIVGPHSAFACPEDGWTAPE